MVKKIGTLLMIIGFISFFFIPSVVNAEKSNFEEENHITPAYTGPTLYKPIFPLPEFKPINPVPGKIPIRLIADKELRKAINEELGYTGSDVDTHAPTKDELERLSELKAQNLGIKRLDGLQYAIGLKRLELGSNNISDLTPLENLKELDRLMLHGNDFNDISPLASLTNLTHLVLNNNNITHGFTALGQLTELDWLDMHAVGISDLSVLRNLNKLTQLTISNYPHNANNAPKNLITDLSALSNVSSLSSIKINNLNLNDDIFKEVANLNNLLRIQAGGNNISDLTPIKHLDTLIDLSIGNNDIHDLTPLKESKWLNNNSGGRLNLYGNHITDLTPIQQILNIGVDFNGKEQSITLPKVNLYSDKDTNLTIDNTIKSKDGAIVHVNKVNDGGNYNGSSKQVTWDGLDETITEVSYTFDDGNDFTGTVVQPITWDKSGNSGNGTTPPGNGNNQGGNGTTPPGNGNNQEASFPDIKDHWAEDFIKDAYQNGWFKGFPDGSFGPDKALTRMQSTSLFVRILGLNENAHLPFTDILGLEQETLEELEAAYAAGIVNGFEDNTFGPYKSITRAQMALIIARTYETVNGSKYIPNAPATFPDIGGYDKETEDAIAMLQELGIAQGDQGNYKPSQSTTRAHMAKMLVNFQKVLSGL